MPARVRFSVLGSRFSVLGSRFAVRRLPEREPGAACSLFVAARFSAQQGRRASKERLTPRRQNAKKERDPSLPAPPPPPSFSRTDSSFSKTTSSVSKTARPSQMSGHCAHATKGCLHETARFPVIQRHFRPFSRIEAPERRFSTLLGRAASLAEPAGVSPSHTV